MIELIPKCCKTKGANRVWVKCDTDSQGGYWATFVKRGSSAISNNGRLPKRERYVPPKIVRRHPPR